MSAAARLAAPPRAFWIPALLADLALIAALPWIGWLAGGLAVIVLAGLALVRAERLLAFLLFGSLLFGLLPADAGLHAPLYYAVRVLLPVGLLIAWARAGCSPAAAIRPVLRDPRTIAVLALTLWLWITLAWTPAPVYGRSKAAIFLLVVPPVYLGAACLWPVWEGGRALERIRGAGLLLGLLVVLLGLAALLGLRVDPAAAGGEASGGPTPARLGWLGANPIWLARALAIWLVLALWAAASGRLARALGVAAALTALALMGLTGSRGPLMALLLAPLGLLLLPRRPAGDRRAGGRLAGMLAALGVLLVLAALLAPPEARTRLGAALLRVPEGVVSAEGTGELTGLVGRDTSTGVRRALAVSALDLAGRSLPWGAGGGAFATAFTGLDWRVYPHNLFAELLIEYGLPGLLLVLFFLSAVWRSARRLARRGAAGVRWIWVLICMALINDQVSGDLGSNEGIWFWGGVLLAMDAVMDEGRGAPVATGGRLRRARAVVLAAALLAAIGAAGRAGATEADSAALAPRTLNVIPAIFYTPETGFGGGGGVITTWRGRDPGGRPNSLGGVALYTEKHQVQALLTPELYLGSGRWKITATAAYAHFPATIYGLGWDSPASAEETFTTESIELSGQLLRRTAAAGWLGAACTWGKSRILETESGGFVAARAAAGRENAWLGGLGPAIAWDTRDNLYAPRRGAFLQASSVFYAHAFGSDLSADAHRLDLRGYLPLGGERVLALQTVWRRAGGEVPLRLYPGLGDHLRGVVQGRYQDRVLGMGQAEARFPIVGRFGGTLFAGAGQVADRWAALEPGRARVVAGGGLRFVLERAERLHLRMDVGAGPQGAEVYFQFSEAF